MERFGGDKSVNKRAMHRKVRSAQLWHEGIRVGGFKLVGCKRVPKNIRQIIKKSRERKVPGTAGTQLRALSVDMGKVGRPKLGSTISIGR